MPILTNQSASIADAAPLLKAHEHAALADDLHCRGDIQGAMIEHAKAAQEYLNSAEYIEDANLQATLRRMHAEQVKLAEEMQRRLAQEERERSRRPVRPIRRGGAPSHVLAPASPFDDGPLSRTSSASQLSSTTTTRNLQDSSSSDRTTGESFMVLGGDWSEAGERFNRFWGNVEGMLEKFSQPVAFATAPLSWEHSDSAGSGDTDNDGISHTPASKRRSVAAPSGGAGSKGKGKPQQGKTKPSSSPKVVDLRFDDDSSDSESFYMVPSSKTPSRTASTFKTPTPVPSASEAKLREENAKLKLEVESYRGKLSLAENLIRAKAGQEAQLRDSIMFAKREAQRHLVSSSTFRQSGLPHPLSNTISANDLSSPFHHHHNPGTSSPNTLQNLHPLPAPPPSSNAALQRRVKELEEELRLCKVDNEKQKAQITRFREKWQSLKESARRKRSQKEASNMVGLSIKEEDEDAGESVSGSAVTSMVAAAPTSVSAPSPLSGPVPMPPGHYEDGGVPRGLA